MPDDEGFDAFYRASYRRLVLQVLLVVGSLEDAEEVVQEALTRALVRWPRIVAYDAPEQWVRRVAFNLAKTRRQHLARRMRALVRHGPPAPEPPVSVETIALMDALRALPMRYRSVLVLHHLVGLPVEEVAAELDLPVGTVKTRLARGRRVLAEHLRPGEEVDGAARRPGSSLPARG
jgi:RNA polymerase sigma-70 factor (ECF subfamily)